MAVSLLRERLANLSKGAAGALPKNLRDTLYLRAFSFLRIPLLFFVSPSVVELSKDHCVVRIPLNRRTKNHLGSMYFGVLCAGADCAGGLIAMQLSQKEGISMIFKDFHAEFLKRAEGDVHFRCEDGPAVRQLIARVKKSGERENIPVHVVATVPSKLGTDPVARFTLTLSLKKR
jgi:acyl-coenzyme A thioesterase PaaI-like protein